jgi:hypothetical protein
MTLIWEIYDDLILVMTRKVIVELEGSNMKKTGFSSAVELQLEKLGRPKGREVAIRLLLDLVLSIHRKKSFPSRLGEPWPGIDSTKPRLLLGISSLGKKDGVNNTKSIFRQEEKKDY